MTLATTGTVQKCSRCGLKFVARFHGICRKCRLELLEAAAEWRQARDQIARLRREA